MFEEARRGKKKVSRVPKKKNKRAAKNAKKAATVKKGALSDEE
jgi:hypothetical protein